MDDAALTALLDKLPDDDGAVPDFAELFGGGAEDEPAGDGEAASLSSPVTGERFPEITTLYAPAPGETLQNPNYYQEALAGAGEKAQRLHAILQKYLNARDPKDRGIFRQQVIPLYWELVSRLSREAAEKMAEPKKLLLRYGLLHPGLLSAEQRDFFARLIPEDEYGQPVYYLDEWFRLIGSGAVEGSSTDEAPSRSSEQGRLQRLLNKARGKRSGALSLLQARDDTRTVLALELKEKAAFAVERRPLQGMPGLAAPLTEAQKQAFEDIQELLKNLARTDRETGTLLADYQEADGNVRSLKAKLAEAGPAEAADLEALAAEFTVIRQMAKMTAGRQGNPFPILTREYFHSPPAEVGFRENVITQLAWIEKIVPDAFCRLYHNRQNRIVPYVILIPSYGDLGICWEPFNRHDRAGSRGRLALPLYPKSLQTAVLAAAADLRWQTAKEKAAYHWMDEGLTGYYYQWFTARKLKGDVKEYFIQDYILWVTKESEGIQKLDKELRALFWRYIPFAQAVKDKLRDRSYIYQELYQRDLNRAMSDGY